MTFNRDGYLVVPNFLDQTEIDAILHEYNKVTPSNNLNYELPACSNKIFELLQPKIKELADQLDETINLWINGFYVDTEKINWGWHQDHEPYYILQQTVDYVNLYIVLSKPDPDLTGMCIIPRSQIEIHAPEQASRITSIGACRYMPVDDHTEVHDDNTGEVFNIPINLETIQIAPQLSPGDMLMLRGDVIHRTQDNLTKRIALSMRCTNGNHVVNKTKILNGCEYKQTIIQYNKDMYSAIIERFGEREEITVSEMFDEHGKQL